MTDRRERKEQIYILAKSFPAPDRQFGDSDCIGGAIINGDDVEWIRLFPVVRRRLFDAGLTSIPSFSLIEAIISKDPGDKRIASHFIYEPSIKVIKKKLTSRERYEIFDKVMKPDLEMLSKERDEDLFKTSLGMIEVEIKKYQFRKLSDSMDEEETEALQLELFEKAKSGFEKPGHDLTVSFKCKNNPDCKGHDHVYKSEEIETTYNKFIKEYPNDYLRRIAEVFENRYMNPEHQVYAVIGTMKKRYYRWLLGGLTHLKKRDIDKFRRKSEVLDLPLEFFD